MTLSLRLCARRALVACWALALAGGGAVSPALAQSGVVPPPDESHATKPIGVCESRHFDPRLEFCDVRDGHLYRFTRIGNQVWMAENLAFGSMISGDRDQTKAGQKYCLYDKASDCGALYQWAEAMALDARFNHQSAALKGQVQGLCPQGWHLPSATDWERLLAFVRKAQGAHYEAVSLMAYSANDDFRWKTNSTPDDMLPIRDLYGMAIVPVGHRVPRGTCPDGPASDSSFCNAHDMAKFWTSEEDSADPEIGVSVTAAEGVPYVMISSEVGQKALTPDDRRGWIASAYTAEEKQKWIDSARRKYANQSALQRSYKISQKTQGMSVRCLRD